MRYAAEERPSPRRSPDDVPRESGYGRNIDCTPHGSTWGPPPVQTGRGRGNPDPERWARARADQEPHR